MDKLSGSQNESWFVKSMNGNYYWINIALQTDRQLWLKYPDQLSKIEKEKEKEHRFYK